MKALLKAETTVPTDYHGFIYQMKAYATIIRIITGESSLPSLQLENLVRLVKKYSTYYKVEITKDKCF